MEINKLNLLFGALECLFIILPFLVLDLHLLAIIILIFQLSLSRLALEIEGVVHGIEVVVVHVEYSRLIVV